MGVDILDAGDLARGNAQELGDLSVEVWRLWPHRRFSDLSWLLLNLSLHLALGVDIYSDQFPLSFDFWLVFSLSFSWRFSLIGVFRLLLR